MKLWLASTHNFTEVLVKVNGNGMSGIIRKLKLTKENVPTEAEVFPSLEDGAPLLGRFKIDPEVAKGVHSGRSVEICDADDPKARTGKVMKCKTTGQVIGHQISA